MPMLIPFQKYSQYLLCVLLLFYACASKRKATSSAHFNHQETIKSILQLNDKEIHTPLYQFISEWYAVPYKYGSCSKEGTDCSGFVNALYQNVYHKSLERKANDIFIKQCKKIDKNDVKEGDLVFFKIETKDISHVGVYLKNNKFVHASTQKGVIISDLNEPYYRKYFYAFGKVK